MRKDSVLIKIELLNQNYKDSFNKHVNPNIISILSRFKSFLLSTAGFFLLFSCTSTIGNIDYLEQTLELAGNNKIELLKVLEHYKNMQDTLKYKAAKFLISNMFDHGYIDRNNAQVVEVAKLEFKKTKTISNTTKGLLSKYEGTNANITYDARKISSEYLINNIDLAFFEWKKRPWSKYYSFDEFCEYVLPYRISFEPLQDWRTICIKRYGYLLDSVYKGTDVIEATKVICQKLKEENFTWIMDFSNMGQASPIFNINYRVGSCFDAVSVAIYVLRSLGIPTHVDGYRFSPETFFSHTWNVVLDTTKTNIPFYYMDYFPVRGNMETDERKKIKVYRNTYAHQEVEKDPYLKTLTQPNQVDVSSEYFTTRLLLPISTLDKYYYLCSFSQERLIPIAKAQVQDRTADFGFVESGNIFVLASVSTKSEQLKIESDAFLFQDGNCYPLKPDMHNIEQATIYRKCSLSKWGWGRLLRILGATFYGGNSLDSIHQKLYTICDTPLVARNIYPLDTTGKNYRYIKYVARHDVPLELAELALFDGNQKLKANNIIAGEPYDAKDPEMQLKNAFDQDPLTYFLSQKNGDKLIIDLGIPHKVTKAVCIPRNDDNFIRAGDEYELYYFTKENGWKLLIRDVATGIALSCKVPRNALLLLKDKTRGKEEQIFLYRNDKQVYLNML